MVYLPVPRRLYDDVVRFSDGRLDLIDIALDQFHDFIRRTADDNCHGLMGSRLDEFLAIYHPDIIERWRNEDSLAEEDQAAAELLRSPLVWKDVEIPAGALVRMQYDGAYHMARVKAGRIVDSEGSFSPSEWASKVAKGTSRNAWRDLFFRLPGKQEWIAASTLRDLRRQELTKIDNLEFDDLLKDI